MSSKVILATIVVLILILLGTIFVVIGIDNPNSFINARDREPSDVVGVNELLVGAWLEPIPGNDTEMQGFVLRRDGTAASINMHTLLYKRWYVDGNSLVLVADSVGNGGTISDERRYTIDTVNENTLKLKNIDLVMEFTRANENEVEVVDTIIDGSVLKKVATEEVEYYGTTKGYLARPDDGGEYPGLILIHEWWGLNDNVRELAEDFAAQGYVALAVNLYSAEAVTTPEEAGVRAGAVRENIDEAFNNLNSAVSYLSSIDSVNPESLAAVGWCFGGGWAYEMAKNDLGIDASVMYYGRFSLEDDLSMMRADILGHFGEEDTSILADDVVQFAAKLNTQGGDHAVFIYPNAGHAFANEDNEDAYSAEAAQMAWQRTMDFLTRELKGVDVAEMSTEVSAEPVSTSTEESE